MRPRLNTYAHHTSYVRNFRTYFTVAVPAELTYVKALVRWATGKRLTNRLPKLSLVTLSPPLNSGILGHRRTCVLRSSLQSLVDPGTVVYQILDMRKIICL